MHGSTIRTSPLSFSRAFQVRNLATRLSTFSTVLLTLAVVYLIPSLVRESDYGNVLNSTVDWSAFPQSNFSEGLYIDYRAFDAKNITPRFEFGYGLSYTTFSY